MLKTRVITALILAISFGLLLFQASSPLWIGFAILMSGIAAWEWAGFAQITRGMQKLQYSFLMVITNGLALTVFDNDMLLTLTLTSTVWMIFAVLQTQKNKGTPVVERPVIILMLGIMSIVLFTQVLIHFREHFLALQILLSLVVVWAIDTGAYFAGKRFGKHKLAIYVSPGKTWQGVWGGFALALIVSWLGLYWLSPNLTISFFWMGLALALIGLISVFGDLYESTLKRQAGLKDSGRIFPGHGGMLDRVDSLMIALPMYYFLWVWTQA